ncbi:MAG: helix-turn-helix domain-containing protein [Cyanobacteria bacterium P01_H01_bin.15]
MARSVKIEITQKPRILQAMQRHGFLTQGYLAAHLGIALSTVNNFINGKPIYVSKFEEICDVLELEPAELIYRDTAIAPPTAKETVNFKALAYDDCWVGRTEIIQTLQTKLKGDTRILLILGLTGIGKTALAENLIQQASDWGAIASPKILRVNGEDTQRDFVAVASRWLKTWAIAVTPDQLIPSVLLETVVSRLIETPQIILFDSFEYFLQPDDSGEENLLGDRLWLEFFQRLLCLPECQSHIVITSQELPSEITQQRFGKVWWSQVLTGLTLPEQKELMARVGFELTENTPETKILLRIAHAYRGHPLVLRVILGEIWEAFGGNILAYWDEVQPKIEAVEEAIATAEIAGQTMGFEDQWRLHKLTRKVRLEVNRQRLQMVFSRLATVPDAYHLLCAASVYRVPVQKQGWLLQLTALTQRLEGKPCTVDRQETALNQLFYRFLVETAIAANNQRLFGLHPLVRSVALEHHQKLIASLQTNAQSA